MTNIPIFRGTLKLFFPSQTQVEGFKPIFFSGLTVSPSFFEPPFEGDIIKTQEGEMNLPNPFVVKKMGSFFPNSGLALGSLAIVKVSGRPPPLAFLGANSAGLEKGSLGSVEGSPNFSLHLSRSLLWLCGRFPQLFCTFVSQFSLRKKVLWKVPPTFSKTTLALGSSAIVKGFFAANGFCLSLERSLNNSLYSLHLSPKLLYKSSLEGSANCALHLSPSVLLGSNLHELFTRLTHTNPFRRKQPIMSLLLGYSLGLSLLC